MNTQAAHTLDSPDDVESGLLDAFWTYERALLDNDVVMLDRLFLAGSSTLRADASGVLVGHDQIAAFRATRPGGAPTRTITALHVRNLGEATRLILAETLRPNGARGLQTQVWQHTSDGWRVSAAHVSAAPPSDPHIWRTMGAPMLAASGAGLLTGQRVAVKDLFALAGQRVGGGTPAYLAAAPVCDITASAVQILLDNGADVIGLAHTDELAYSIAGVNPHYGTPANPAAPGRIPGGSSSGPACAVSRGESDIGLGTDTAGSVRVPASYQGLWGLRTTHGVIPSDGMLPLAPSFDSVGWLTRDLQTLRGIAAVAIGDHPQHTSPIEVVVDPALVSYADFATAQAFWAAIRTLKQAVAIRYADVVDDRFDDWFTAFRTVQGFEAWRTHAAFLTAHPDAVARDVATRFAAASRITTSDADAARDRLRCATEYLDDRLEEGAILLMPTTPGPAPFPGGLDAVREATLRMTCLASLTGRPAVSAPLLQPEGLPVGLAVLGWRHSDLRLLEFCADVQACLDDAAVGRD